ncbi:MAG: hypothetical protein NXH97_17720 [Rhodobacteraceae bacterium]|nr:hypothetical protein [Paracoccaceae bacterium]
MTASLVFLPRALWIAALVGFIVCAFYLLAPRVAGAYAAPVENTHLLPEQDAAFRQAMAALGTPDRMVC